MAKHVLDQDFHKTWSIDSDNDTWILDEGAAITVNGKHGIVDDGHVGSTIRVLGDITVRGSGFSAVYDTSEGSTIVFGKGAHVDASKAWGGLFAAGADAVGINNGFVESGTFYGLHGGWGSLMINNGTISGYGGIHSFAHAGESAEGRNNGLIRVSDIGMGGTGGVGTYVEFTNGKHGRVISADEGVTFSDDTNGLLTNRGLIKGVEFAVTDSGGESTLINTGRIIGTIDMGDGHDTLDLARGTLKGIAYGGDGFDVYLVSRQATDIRELFLGGNDLVRSTASYALRDNFEKLDLLGSKNLSGTGNDDNNHLNGNSGNNLLKGLGGADWISGGAGDDRLEGGDGIDTFVFSSGFGNDVIEDFFGGIDKIDLTIWNGIDSYADLISHHMTVDGDDLVFTVGDETLSLKNVDAADVSSTDFIL